MTRWSLGDLDRNSETFDAAAARLAEGDRFCSSTSWILPAHQVLHLKRHSWIYAGAGGWVALAIGHFRGIGPLLEPLEAFWGLASPFVGHDLEGLVEEFAAFHFNSGAARVPLLLSGIPERSALLRQITRVFGAHRDVSLVARTHRFVGRLSEGLDAYLERRSPRFRRNLRAARRRTANEGVDFEYATPPASGADAEVTRLLSRVLDVEKRSWKGRDGHGLVEPSFLAFYHAMLSRLIARQRIRTLFARREGEDIGYAFGAVFAGTFRGLQMSFDDRFRHLSLGNCMHQELIERACTEEGCDAYDLGADGRYKERWADENTVLFRVLIR